MYICYVLDVRLVDDDYHLTPISISCLSYFLLIVFRDLFSFTLFSGLIADTLNLHRRLLVRHLESTRLVPRILLLYLPFVFKHFSFSLLSIQREKENEVHQLFFFSFLFNWISLVMVVPSPYSIYLLRTIFFQNK
jgi:hypothetical protein